MVFVECSVLPVKTQIWLQIPQRLVKEMLRVLQGPEKTNLERTLKTASLHGLHLPVEYGIGSLENPTRQPQKTNQSQFATDSCRLTPNINISIC